MRNLTLVIALFLMSMVTVNAQSEGKETTFGIKAGVNLAKLKDSNAKNKLGMVAGVFAEHKISNTFGVRIEALYSMQGAKVNSEKVKLNYLNLPVLAKVYATDKLSFEVGPQASLLMKEKSALSKKDYKKLDLAAVGGISYKLIDNLEIGARYNLGLRDITKVSGKPKNSVFQLSLSYSF